MTQTRNAGLYGTGKAAGQIVRALEASPHRLTTAISFLEEEAPACDWRRTCTHTCSRGPRRPVRVSLAPAYCRVSGSM